MIRKSLLTLTLIGVIILPDIGSAQMAGNYDLVGVYNVYNYVVREMSNSLADSLDASYVLQAHWPSSESPLFSTNLATYEVGDTVGPVVVPLVNPMLLAMFGIALTSDIYEDGNMVISGTYPSLSTSNCETQVTIPAITDNATYATGGDPITDQDELTAIYGFGLVESGVFANNMYPPNFAGGETYGVDFGPGTEHPTWGMWTSYYNADFSFIESAEFYWEQVDGVSSDQGVDEQGEFDGHLGLSAAFGDSSTVPYLAAAFPALGLNVGTYPIIGGTGYDLNGDGEPDGVVPAPSLTEDGLEWGYLFDPTGALLGGDDVPFNGDEPFQFTGYYMTYNFLAFASGIQTAVGPDADGDGVPDNIAALIVQFMTAGYTQDQATVLAINAIGQAYFVTMATMFGVDSITAAAAAVNVGSYADSVFQALYPNVLTGALTLEEVLTTTGSATAVYAIGVLASLGVVVDDSDHDYVQGGNGRLVFQVGNNCIPRNQHVAVQSFWVNTGTAGVDSDESLIPKEFALYDNYPNPFNPTTQIAVDLPEAAATEITVWNIMGQKVATLYSGDLNAGHHSLNFNGRDSNGKQLTSGMYLYRVTAGKYNATKKMTLMK